MQYNYLNVGDHEGMRRSASFFREERIDFGDEVKYTPNEASFEQKKFYEKREEVIHVYSLKHVFVLFAFHVARTRIGLCESVHVFCRT